MATIPADDPSEPSELGEEDPGAGLDVIDEPPLPREPEQRPKPRPAEDQPPSRA